MPDISERDENGFSPVTRHLIEIMKKIKNEDTAQQHELLKILSAALNSPSPAGSDLINNWKENPLSRLGDAEKWSYYKIALNNPLSKDNQKFSDELKLPHDGHPNAVRYLYAAKKPEELKPDDILAIKNLKNIYKTFSAAEMTSMASETESPDQIRFENLASDLEKFIENRASA